MVVWCRAWEIWNNYAAIFQCSGFKAANRQPNLLFYFLNGQTTVESYELDQMLWNIFDIRIGYTKLRHIHCAVIRSALVMVNDSECANRINGRIPWTLNTLIHKRMTNNIHTLRTLYTCIADSIQCLSDVTIGLKCISSNAVQTYSRGAFISMSLPYEYCLTNCVQQWINESKISMTHSHFFVTQIRIVHKIRMIQL